MGGLTRLRLADKPTTEVHTWIDAAPKSVWRLVSDITLMPALSDELYAVEWVPPATGPGLGAAFRGCNRRGDTQWSTVSYIVDYKPVRVFAWAVNHLTKPGAIWRFTLQPDREGTVLNQWVQIGPGQSGVSTAIQAHPDSEQDILVSRLREFDQGMEHNLAVIKAIAETT
ncbi:SRPBCC family protein [Mycobacterium intracellulare]|uniref:SRPBCC family protein n=1 Tax=Mycobacterium intracellulare TaxID=1767 RepID=UPI00044B4F02|nr:SRPBCC family protein [Mycobacterium intracellulare]ETZ36113.1 polyketide cyclase / dehydrase and lipid transport family protein [Mycobacterium intracellulare MIN_061107_1834]MCA2273948.1 SRPBCC family protein [Mycobacterium intracellulare]MCA2324669.1 SRPBCC family protein [Mycobacterium intracellulare]UEB22630.1 SRPBCC family protein [Mycobacterium intracellulare]WVL05612.1 SRPBCC family protein [Mycobacterium intracellulare]